MRPDLNDVRCATCGRPWNAWDDPETGRGEGPHPEDTTCSRYRPVVAPPWVAEALARHELAATASDAEKARREVAGGVPTREWPANGEAQSHA